MVRVVVGVLLLASCFESPDEPLGPQVTSRVTHHSIPLAHRPQLDLLFVIDNSPEMAPRHVGG